MNRKIDYEERIIAFKEKLTRAEENKLKESMQKKGFTFGKQEENTYYFIKYNNYLLKYI